MPSLDGLFTKCRGCKQPVYEKELRARYNVCPDCQFHYPIPAWERVRLLVDSGSFKECDAEITAADPLSFEGYGEKLREARQKSKMEEAVLSGVGEIDGCGVSLAVMDFRFIGGSMGSVVGEKVARAAERALEEERALVVVSASGGARMYEGIYSLMQLARTSAALAEFSEESPRPYVSILTDPTFGGVTASYATAADVILSEPGARIGFAGRRVIEGSTKERLPEGFQTAEFQREHGMVDRIVHRLSLRRDLERLLGFFG